MEPFDWWYDDARQVGLDFEDEAQVAAYDARQGRSPGDDVALLTRLGLGPDMTVADLGCGTGMLICEAARLCRAAVGVDVSDAMLRAAKRRGADLGCGNLTFQRAGFLSFEAPAQAFDLITTKNALHHLPDFWKALALARIYAALKPGGRFYLRDVMFSASPHDLTAQAEGWVSWLGANSGYTREDAACHVREEHSTFDWVIARMLADCGFNVVEHTQDGVYGAFVAERAA